MTSSMLVYLVSGVDGGACFGLQVVCTESSLWMVDGDHYCTSSVLSLGCTELVMTDSGRKEGYQGRAFYFFYSFSFSILY